MSVMSEEADSKYADIIDYDWTQSSLRDRMPLSQRAKIFLPFSALTGYDEALQAEENTVKDRCNSIEAFCNSVLYFSQGLQMQSHL